MSFEVGEMPPRGFTLSPYFRRLFASHESFLSPPPPPLVVQNERQRKVSILKKEFLDIDVSHDEYISREEFFDLLDKKVINLPAYLRSFLLILPGDFRVTTSSTARYGIS